MDRTPDCGSGGCGFDPRRARTSPAVPDQCKLGGLAERLCNGFENHRAEALAGSTPAPSANVKVKKIISYEVGCNLAVEELLTELVYYNFD